jgi:hypothetical protein
LRRVRRGPPRLEGYGAAAVAVIAGVLFAGCGGDSNKSGATASTAAGTTSKRSPKTADNLGTDGTQSDLFLIQKSLLAVFASGDPAQACETYATGKYVTTAFGDTEGCKAAQTAGGSAKSVKATNFTVSNETATATVVPTGGPSAGEKIDVRLVKDAGTWKVDSAVAPNAAVGP